MINATASLPQPTAAPSLPNPSLPPLAAKAAGMPVAAASVSMPAAPSAPVAPAPVAAAPVAPTMPTARVAPVAPAMPSVAAAPVPMAPVMPRPPLAPAMPSNKPPFGSFTGAPVGPAVGMAAVGAVVPTAPAPQSDATAGTVSAGNGGKPTGTTGKNERHIKIKLPVALAILGLVFVLIGGVVAYYLSTQNQEVRQQAAAVQCAVPGEIRCSAANGACMTTAQCAQRIVSNNLSQNAQPTCPSGKFACSTAGGACMTADQCSQQTSCPSGKFKCSAAGGTCMTADQCNQAGSSTASTCPFGKFACSTAGGACMTADQCSQQTSCPSGKFKCSAAGGTCMTADQCNQAGTTTANYTKPSGASTSTQTNTCYQCANGNQFCTSYTSNSTCTTNCNACPGNQTSSNNAIPTAPAPAQQAPAQTTNAACSQAPVNVQFRLNSAKDPTPWVDGATITNGGYKPNTGIDVNCFSNNGSQLLTSGYFMVTSPSGATTQMGGNGTITNFIPSTAGQYTFTCKSTSVQNCFDTDQFTIAAAAPAPTPVPTPVPTPTPQTLAQATPTPAPTPTPQTNSCNSYCNTGDDKYCQGINSNYVCYQNHCRFATNVNDATCYQSTSQGTTTTTTPTTTQTTVANGGATPVTGQTEDTILVVFAGFAFLAGGGFLLAKRRV